MQISCIDYTSWLAMQLFPSPSSAPLQISKLSNQSLIVAFYCHPCMSVLPIDVSAGCSFPSRQAKELESFVVVTRVLAGNQSSSTEIQVLLWCDGRESCCWLITVYLGNGKCSKWEVYAVGGMTMECGCTRCSEWNAATIYLNMTWWTTLFSHYTTHYTDSLTIKIFKKLIFFLASSRQSHFKRVELIRDLLRYHKSNN